MVRQMLLCLFIIIYNKLLILYVRPFGPVGGAKCKMASTRSTQSFISNLTCLIEVRRSSYK